LLTARCPKAKFTPANCHLDIGEPGDLQTVPQTRRFHRSHWRSDVYQSKGATGDAVGASENSSRTQDPRNLCEQFVLPFHWRNVMEHRETHREVKACIAERHAGAISLDYSNFRVSCAEGKRVCQCAIWL
jgi:hypothetical protein